MKTDKVLNGEYLAIEWIDSSSYPGWRFTENECDFAVPEVLTVGRLYKNYKDFLAIVLSYGKENEGNPEQVNGVIAIPKSAIKRMYSITELEEINLDHYRLIDAHSFKENSGIKYITTEICVKERIKHGDGIDCFSYGIDKVKEAVLNDFAKKLFDLCCERFADGKSFKELDLYSEFAKYEEVEGDENVKSKYPTLKIFNSSDKVDEYVERKFVEWFNKNCSLKRPPYVEEVNMICGGGEFPFLYAYVNNDGEVLYRLVR